MTTTPGELLALDERLARAQKNSFDIGERQSSIDFQDARAMIARLAAKPADEGLAPTSERALALQAVRADERLACWKIADKERNALKNADPSKPAWLVAFDIANAIKMRDHALSTTGAPKP